MRHILIDVGDAVFYELKDVLSIMHVEVIYNAFFIPILVVCSPDYLVAMLMHAFTAL